MNSRSNDLVVRVRAIAEETRELIVQLNASKHDAAIKVQEAILRKIPNGRCDFPYNWCDFSSCVLGVRLARVLDRSDIDLCIGKKGDEKHWWIRIQNIDIDITADQFGDVFNGITVIQSSSEHRNRFPEISVCPLIARHQQSEYFEYALFSLNKAVDKEYGHRKAAALFVSINEESNTDA